MSVCSTSGGSVTSQRAGASICARSPTALTLKSSAQCVHFQSFYLLCQVPRGSVEEVYSKPPPILQARIPLFACSAPNGRFYSSANQIATPRRIGPTMKAMGAVKTNRADLLTATDIDRSRSIASLVKESTTAATRERVRPIGDAGQKEAPWRGRGRDSQPRLRTPRKLFIAHAALAIAHCDHFLLRHRHGIQESLKSCFAETPAGAAPHFIP